MDEYSTRILLQSILGQVITVSPSKYGLKKGISPRNWCWSLPPGSAVLGSTASVFNGCLSGIHLTRVTSLLFIWSWRGSWVWWGSSYQFLFMMWEWKIHFLEQIYSSRHLFTPLCFTGLCGYICKMYFSRWYSTWGGSGCRFEWS